MKRLFIEIDEQETGDIETKSILGSLMHKLPETKNFFDTVLDDALGRMSEAWEAVKLHDEIYCSTALIPIFGFGSSYGSGTLFNNLMWKAKEEGTVGKSIFIFRQYEDIRWEELKKDLVDVVFRKNYLYVEDEECDNWIQVDIDKLIKEELYDSNEE